MLTHAVTATALAGILAQLGRPLASLITLPFLLANLGEPGLGVWMIALSLMGLVATLNSGLSISLVTSIGRASAQNSVVYLSRLCCAGTLIAIATAALMLALFLPVVWMLDWAGLLGIDGHAAKIEVRPTLTVLALLAALSMLASVGRQVMVGRMHGYIVHLIDLMAVIIGSMALLVALALNLPLWVLAMVFMGPAPLLMMIGGLIYVRRFGIAMFSPRHLNRQITLSLGRDSLRMVGYHSAYSISSQSDLFLVGITLGASSSAIYGVAQRIFSLPILLAQAINQAQWPAFAKADAAGDEMFVRKLLGPTLILLPMIATAMAAIAALVYPDLLRLWLGHQLPTDHALLVGMVSWVLVATLVGIYDSVLRAKNATATLARSMWAMAIINISATLVLLKLIGYSGAIWGSVIGYTIALLIPYAIRQHAPNFKRQHQLDTR